MNIDTITPWRVATMAALILVASCDPSVIAPLPSPNTPDKDHIAVSSLGLVTDDNERLVALVGFEGAVEGAGEVVVFNPRTEQTQRFGSTEAGSFSAALYGRAGDALELAFQNEKGGLSEPLTITVLAYEPPLTGSPEPAEPTDGAPPAIPGGRSDYESPGPCPDEADTEDCQLTDDGDRGGRLDVIWSFNGDELTIYGDAGFTSPHANVVLANNHTGAVHLAVADDTGAVLIQVPARTGDEMLMFSQSAQDPSLTSPAIHFTVPSNGGMGGTDTPAGSAP